MRRTNRQGNLPVSAVTTNIRRMTYLGTPLLDANGGWEAARTLLNTLVAHRRSAAYRMAVIEWLAADGQAADFMREVSGELGLPVYVYEDFEQPFLTRRAQPTYAESQSKKHRKDYERRARRLADVLGADLELVNRAGDAAAVDEFLTLEAAGYKGDNGVAMTTRPGEPEYFHEVCRRYAALGRLHVLQLRGKGRTVAMQVSVEAQDGLFLLKVTHNEAFAHYDPGIQLHLRAMEYFHHETAAQFIRVCTFAGNELLLRLYPERRRTSTWMVGLGGRVDQALLGALPAARALRHRVRQATPRRLSAARSTTS